MPSLLNPGGAGVGLLIRGFRRRTLRSATGSGAARRPYQMKDCSEVALRSDAANILARIKSK
jgi:hypothetical protein